MENFTPLTSTIGGLLLGVSSAIVLLFNGRIAGVSGIAGGILRWRPGEIIWRSLFVIGLIGAGAVYYQLSPEAFAFTIDRSVPTMAVAGFLVGVGTHFGNGCTSGHGICGMSRLSKRSFVSVAVFCSFAALTVMITQALS